MKNGKTWSLRSCVEDLRIKQKIFMAIFLTAAMACVLLGCTVYWIAKGILIRQTKEFTQEYLDQLSGNLENRTDVLLNSTYSLMTQTELTDILQSKESNGDNNSLLKQRQKIRALGNVQFGSSEHVDAYYLQSTSGAIFWWMQNRLKPQHEEINQENAGAILKAAGQALKSSGKNTYWYQANDRIYLVRNIIDPLNIEKALGIVAFEIDPDFFEIASYQTQLIRNQNLAFFNRSSGCLVADDSVGIILRSEAGIGTGEGSSNSGSRSITYADEHYLMSQRIGINSSWNLYCLIRESEILTEMSEVKLYTAFVLFLMLMIAFAISFFLSGSMTRNIDSLEKNMCRVESGDFSVRIAPVGGDEIGMLCRQFNYMAAKIEELVASAYEEGKEKQKLQMQVLKAQINPHFLYNSLGSIRCLAKANHDENVAQMLTSLIAQLRAALSKTGEYQTVAEEIEYIKNYFVLQKYRYQDCFRVEYKLDDQANSCIILNFLLQPLVENAIFHGLEMSKGDGLIRICTQLEDEALILSVSDNGVGMSQDKIDEILLSSGSRYAGLTSIGVSNVQQRIQRYYGPSFGLHYTSEVGAGTTVEIRLPIVRSKNKEKEESKDV